MILQEEFKKNGYKDILVKDNASKYDIDLDDIFDQDQKPEELLSIFISNQKDELFFLLDGNLMKIDTLCDYWDDCIRVFTIINGKSETIHKLKYNIVQLIVYSGDTPDKSREASYLPIKGLQQLLKTIGKVRKQINPKLQVGGILFTMVDAHTNDARNNMELLRNAYGSQIHIFDNYIPFSVRMKEAVREGQSIFSYDPKSKATEAYRRVTEEVLEDAI